MRMQGHWGRLALGVTLMFATTLYRASAEPGGADGETAEQEYVRAPVASRWEVGDSWTVRVEEDPNSDTGFTYLVHIAVTGSEAVGWKEEDCWRLEFSHGEGPLASSRHGRYEILVSKRDGVARRMTETPRTRADWPIQRYGDLRLPLQPAFMPTRVLPVNTDPKVYPFGDDNRVVVARDQTIDVQFVDGSTGEVFERFRQVWPAGAKWWSEYEYYGRDGTLFLRARRLTEEELAAPPPPVEDEAEARAHDAALRQRLNRLLRRLEAPDAPDLAGAPATAVRLQLDAALEAAEDAWSKAFGRWAYWRPKGQPQEAAAEPADREEDDAGEDPEGGAEPQNTENPTRAD